MLAAPVRQRPAAEARLASLLSLCELWLNNVVLFLPHADPAPGLVLQALGSAMGSNLLECFPSREMARFKNVAC